MGEDIEATQRQPYEKLSPGLLAEQQSENKKSELLNSNCEKQLDTPLSQGSFDLRGALGQRRAKEKNGEVAEAYASAHGPASPT